MPIKDRCHRKVREGQGGYHRLLGRWSLLYKNLFYAFFFLQRNSKDVGSSTEKGWGRGLTARREGGEELQRLSLGWRVFYLRPLRVPEIINMPCHSCFSSGDFIQSLQKLRIKCHAFVFWRAKLSPKQGSSAYLGEHVRPETFAER